jgi:hypothetical protein
MKLGKRTDRLVREAMVLGFAEGCRWAGYVYQDNGSYPRDSDVVDRVYRTAGSFNDLYPLLSRCEREAA